MPRYGGERAEIAQVAVPSIVRSSEQGIQHYPLSNNNSSVIWRPAPTIVLLGGARRRDRLKEALGALDLTLTAKDLASLADAVPTDAVSGERYPVEHLAHLDSEKGRWHG